MGGSGGSAPTEIGFRSQDLERELAGLRDPNSPEAQRIQGLIQGRVSDEEAVAQRQSLAAIQGGAQSAIQGARANAASRGLFSSDIGIGLEQNAQQNLAGQQAQLFSQQAQGLRQGTLAGLQASQQRAGLRGSLANQIAQGRLGAETTELQAAQGAFAGQQQTGLAQVGQAANLIQSFF